MHFRICSGAFMRMHSRINEEGSGFTSYFTKNKRNEPLRSAAIRICNEGRTIVLRINFYLNTPLAQDFPTLLTDHNFDFIGVTPPI